jgi:hypothetical protein
VISIIEKNISNVLVGLMPQNRHIDKARDTLIFMIDNLPIDNTILSFIFKNISTVYTFNAKVVSVPGAERKLIPNKFYTWKDLDPYSLPLYEGGTYLFHPNLTGNEYIGSASCHSDRAIQHIEQFRGINPRSLHIQEKDNYKSLMFSIIHEIPSFFKLFRKNNPTYRLSQGQYEILLALTLYPVRILEQDLIDQFKPIINGKGGEYNTTVYHKFTSTAGARDISNLDKKMFSLQGSIPVNIYNLDGTLDYPANSLNDARKYLQMSYRTIPLYLNNVKPFFSYKLNKLVTLREPAFTGELSLNTIEHKLKNTDVLNLPNYSLNELSTLFLYCFNSDKTTFSTFFTLTEAYRNLFPKNTKYLIENNKTFTGPYNYIRNRVNIDVPVLSENGNHYYFAKNPNRKDTEIRENSVVWVISTQCLSAKLFPNLKKVVEFYSEPLSTLSLSKCNYYKNTGGRSHKFIDNIYFFLMYNLLV